MHHLNVARNTRNTHSIQRMHLVPRKKKRVHPLNLVLYISCAWEFEHGLCCLDAASFCRSAAFKRCHLRTFKRCTHEPLKKKQGPMHRLSAVHNKG